MKPIVYKELRLVNTIATYFFPLLGILMLIPAYPYIVSLLYFFFPIQIAFQAAKANRDDEFSLMLPISKNQFVLGKHFLVGFCQLLQVLGAVPFALLTSLLLNKGGNPIGMDANFAFFGYVLIGYSIFNIIFLPNFFKSGYKLGISLVLGILGFSLFVVIFEIVVAFVPVLKDNLDTLSTDKIGIQIAFLVFGIVVYAATMFASYKLSCKNYAKVN